MFKPIELPLSGTKQIAKAQVDEHPSPWQREPRSWLERGVDPTHFDLAQGKTPEWKERLIEQLNETRKQNQKAHSSTSWLAGCQTCSVADCRADVDIISPSFQPSQEYSVPQEWQRREVKTAKVLLKESQKAEHTLSHVESTPSLATSSQHTCDSGGAIGATEHSGGAIGATEQSGGARMQKATAKKTLGQNRVQLYRGEQSSNNQPKRECGRERSCEIPGLHSCIDVEADIIFGVHYHDYPRESETLQNLEDSDDDYF